MWSLPGDGALTATILAALIAGAGTAALFLLRREHHPRIEFRVDVRVAGDFGDAWIVEYLALVENKGQVPHRMEGLSFDVRGLKRGDDLSAGPPAIRGQVFFRRQLAPKDPSLNTESLMPTDPGSHVLLYPATSMRYMYVDHVSKEFRFLLIHGILTRRHGQPIRADRVVSLPSADPEAPS